MKTLVTAKNPDLFDLMLDGYEASFGTGPAQAGEVIGYQMFNANGGLIGGLTGMGVQADRRSITKAFSDALAANAGSVYIQVQVRNLSTSKNSAYGSLPEGLEFVFPSVS